MREKNSRVEPPGLMDATPPQNGEIGRRVDGRWMWVDGSKGKQNTAKRCVFFSGLFRSVLICNVWLGDVGGKDG